jgi:hypothetical protein
MLKFFVTLVIPSPFAVILSEAKNLALPAQDKLREGSLQFAQGKLREESRSGNKEVAKFLLRSV